MIVKIPAVYDVSHWKTITDFRLISPRPALMITKASEGVAFVDTDFVNFFAGMKLIGCKRGAYHFNRKAYDGAGQARHFLNIVNGYITDDDLLILDVEEGGEDASQLQAWFDTVRTAKPRNRVVLYSRRNILEAIPMTPAQKEYFKQIPVWVAGYPFDPDSYDAVPNFYIPDPTRFGAVVLWQYSEKGQITGIVGDVDLNWVSPTYAKLLGLTTPPEEPMPLYYKVTAAELNARSTGAFIADGSNVVGKLLRDDIVQADEPVNGWRRIHAIYRNNAPVALPASPTGQVWVSGAYLIAAVYVPPVVTPPAGLPDVLWIGETQATAREYRKVA